MAEITNEVVDRGDETKYGSLEYFVRSRPDHSRVRDAWRNPAETLSFFGLEQQHFVVELMPGATMWYTDIIAPFVGGKGRYAALNFRREMINALLDGPDDPRGNYFDEFAKEFPQRVIAKHDMESSPLAFDFDSVPNDILGQVDMVIITRELHAYGYKPGVSGFLKDDLKLIFDLMKPGGVVGVEQHRAVEEATRADCSGPCGYLKQSDVIKDFESAGFLFEASSEINANPKDRPLTEQRTDGTAGLVWRLPPTSIYGDVDRTLFESIGESDRMTLRFRKP